MLKAPFYDTAPHESDLTLNIKPLSTVTFTDTSSGTLLFGGLLVDPMMIFNATTEVEYRCTCRDYTYYADSRLVTGTFLNQTAKQIITSVVNNSQTGITADPNMPDGPLITAVQFDHQTISDVISQISQLASWQSDYAFYIDYSRVLHWISQSSAQVVNVLVTDKVTGLPTASRAYIDHGQPWSYEWDGTTIRNKCVVRGASKKHVQTDTWSGDGATTQWTLAFAMDTAGSITLTVAGSAKTIEVTTTPASTTRQFCLYQAPNGQWSLIKGTASTPLSGEAIALTYTSQQPITNSYENGASEVQYNGPNGGVFEIFLADNSIKDATMAIYRARAEVQQFGNAQERYTFTIVENWPGHIRTGQRFSAETSWIPDAQNSWHVGSSGWTDTFIIHSLRIEGRQGNRRQYHVQAARVVG